MKLQRHNREMQTIAEERKNATFNVREMTYFLDGGKENTKRKELICQQIERDPILTVPNFFDMTIEESRIKTMQQIRRMHEIRRQLKDPQMIRMFGEIMSRYDRSFTMRLYVHDVLFDETIWSQGTPEQYKKWEDDIKNMRILGCFAMTELGHSSFLRGIEVTATYDKSAQQFVIHSPTLTSTKWWIGMAGEVATHTVALCQLRIDDKEYGLHWFIIPLRDRDTGRLLPGVTAGSLGAKMGRAGVDNGWIQFSNVRIPRENMLMKWAHVSPDGKYTPPPNPTIPYATLIGERIIALVSICDQVAQCVTIAVRYGAVRRQGPNEQQILNYQTHQYALMPIIAGCYALFLLRRTLEQSWQNAQKQPPEQYLMTVQDYHGIAAGLKAWFGWWGADALEAIRRTMGGHGYSAYNAIAGHIADYGVLTMGGGDNIVLVQQCARYLLSSYQRVRVGKSVLNSVSYFKDYEKILSWSQVNIRDPSDLLNPEFYLHAFKWLCLTMIAQAESHLASDISHNIPAEEAWNNNMLELINTTRPHCILFVLENFYNLIKAVDDLNLQSILMKLCHLFALWNMSQLSTHFLEFGLLDINHTKMIRSQVMSLCRDIRENAVCLVDAFNYPDWILKSPLGRYDGNIYEHYFSTILKATKWDGNVVPYWDTEVRPLLNSKL